jgi:hypothetical protein
MCLFLITLQKVNLGHDVLYSVVNWSDNNRNKDIPGDGVIQVITSNERRGLVGNNNSGGDGFVSQHVDQLI